MSISCQWMVLLQAMSESLTDCPTILSLPLLEVTQPLGSWSALRLVPSLQLSVNLRHPERHVLLRAGVLVWALCNLLFYFQFLSVCWLALYADSLNLSSLNFLSRWLLFQSADHRCGSLTCGLTEPTFCTFATIAQ